MFFTGDTWRSCTSGDSGLGWSHKGEMPGARERAARSINSFHSCIPSI